MFRCRSRLLWFFLAGARHTIPWRCGWKIIYPKLYTNVCIWQPRPNSVSSWLVRPPSDDWRCRRPPGPSVSITIAPRWIGISFLRDVDVFWWGRARVRWKVGPFLSIWELNANPKIFLKGKQSLRDFFCLWYRGSNTLLLEWSFLRRDHWLNLSKICINYSLRLCLDVLIVFLELEGGEEVLEGLMRHISPNGAHPSLFFIVITNNFKLFLPKGLKFKVSCDEDGWIDGTFPEHGIHSTI